MHLHFELELWRNAKSPIPHATPIRRRRRALQRAREPSVLASETESARCAPSEARKDARADMTTAWLRGTMWRRMVTTTVGRYDTSR